jgi:hypothetical protein
MQSKQIIIDDVEENSPEFIEASRMYFKGRIYDLEKRLKKTEENLVIAQAAANYNKKKLESWKNKYYTLVNQNQKNEKSI